VFVNIVNVDYNQPMTRWLTIPDAARRLGVKPQTVYAYISRGMLVSQRQPGGRTSVVEASAVEQLARRGRPGRRSSSSGGLDVPVASAVTYVDGERLYYRGRDAVELADTEPFEAVAGLLWDASPEPWPWPAPPLALERARTAAAQLPPSAHLADRLRVIAAVVGPCDPLRFDLRPEAVVGAGRSLLAVMVDGLPMVARSVPAPSLAGRLWARLSARRASRAGLASLNACLVLMADHELAASTLAARVAASTRADPYAVVTAGLGAIAGPLHGSASAAVHELLTGAAASGPTEALSRVVRAQGRVPGLGQPLYPNGDPRGRALLERLRAGGVDAGRLEVVDALLKAIEERSSVAPNCDFGLAAFAFCWGMPADAGEAIFAIARTAGWLAHALEEYGEEPLRFRPRAIYAGRAPTTRSSSSRREEAVISATARSNTSRLASDGAR